MMLTRVEGRLKLPHGEDGFLFDGDGRVHFRLAAPGTHDGALRAPGTVTTSVTAGVMAPVELAPGLWQVEVDPDKARCWRFKLEITPDTLSVDLASYAPTVEVEGVDYARGLSAYEVAVSDGYQGTRTQWLESLHAGYAGVKAYETDYITLCMEGPAIEVEPARNVLTVWTPELEAASNKNIWSVNFLASRQHRAINELSYDERTRAIYSGFGDWSANGDFIAIVKHDLDTGTATVISDRLATEALGPVVRHGDWLYAPHIDYNGNYWRGGGYATDEGGIWHDVRLPGGNEHTFAALSTPDGLWMCGSSLYHPRPGSGPCLWFRPNSAVDAPGYDDQGEYGWDREANQFTGASGWRRVFIEPERGKPTTDRGRYYEMVYEDGRVWVHCSRHRTEYPERGFLPDGTHIEAKPGTHIRNEYTGPLLVEGYRYSGGSDGVITRWKDKQ
ncbi:hypothetical protein ACUH97_07920 [Dermabacteraceae bacterium P13088]